MEMDSDLHKYTMILLLRLLLIMNNYSSELWHQCCGNTLMWSIFHNVNHWKLRSIMRMPVHGHTLGAIKPVVNRLQVVIHSRRDDTDFVLGNLLNISQ